MRESATFWRLTFVMKIDRLNMKSEFRRHATAIPGTKREAVRHLRKVYAKMWPSAKIRLVDAKPDRQAEARAAKESASA